MRKLRNILVRAALGNMFAGCVGSDIPPKSILSGKDIYNEGGITACISGLYNQLLMEDSNMSNQSDYNGFFFWNCIIWNVVSTGEAVNHNNVGIYTPQEGY